MKNKSLIAFVAVLILVIGAAMLYIQDTEATTSPVSNPVVITSVKDENPDLTSHDNTLENKSGPRELTVRATYSFE